MPAPSAADKKRYERHKEKAAERQRRISAAGKEIGPLPKVKNPKRRAKCKGSLRLFCETYLAERFGLAWGDDHLTAIGRIEASLLRGGSFALAMPRGSGKTTITEAGALWAILYGHRRFVALIGASEDAAVEMLASIKVAVEEMDPLGEDFPEACHPVRALGGQMNKTGGQTLDGRRTRITWNDKEVVFPTVKGAPSSGAVVRVAGITGRVRGMKAATADGTVIRPDVAIADDPQDDESAESLAQTAKREKVLKGAVKGLAGPGKTITLIAPVTVIARGDLSDRLLDRERNPSFRGERMRMVYQFPTAAPLWDKYADLRRDSFRRGGEGEQATEFYREHRAEMDAGAVVGWPARFDHETELSAVQAAMNLKIDNPIAFAAEYQNEPLVEALPGMRSLDPDALAARLSGVPRGQVPRECSTLTAFVDAGKHLLWYAVAAWDARFGGALIDYGTWPGQTRPYFRRDDPRPSLAGKYPALQSDDARLYAGLRDLTAAILGREYPRHETGEPHRVAVCLVDRGYKPEVVHKVCRESAHAAVLRPSIGHAVGSTGRAVRQWAELPGEVSAPPGAPAWRWGYAKGEHATGRRVVFDADEWKTFAADRLTGDPGGYAPLLLPGDDRSAHAMLRDHLAAEFGAPARTTGGLEYEKWAARPNRDLDLFDCAVGCCVAASVAGVRWSAAAAAGEPAKPPPGPKKRVKWSEKYAEKFRG